MNDDYNLLVFHEKETEALLKKLDLIDKVNSEQIHCAACSKVITKENFGAVFEKFDTILLVCDDLKCLRKIEEIRNAP